MLPLELKQHAPNNTDLRIVLLCVHEAITKSLGFASKIISGYNNTPVNMLIGIAAQYFCTRLGEQHLKGGLQESQARFAPDVRYNLIKMR